MTDNWQSTHPAHLTVVGAQGPGTVPDRHVVGIANRTRMISSGLFVCPAEATPRAYWMYQVREWKTLLSIPLVPGRVVERYVECFGCGATAHPAVVDAKHPALGSLFTRP